MGDHQGDITFKAVNCHLEPGRNDADIRAYEVQQPQITDHLDQSRVNFSSCMNPLFNSGQAP